MDSRIFGPKRLACHVGVLVVFLVCLRLGWWQWQRSQDLGGAAQNLAYALLWPVFGAYAVYVWVRLLKMELSGYQGRQGNGGPILGRPDGEMGDGSDQPSTALLPYVAPDPELVAYNAYLSALNQQAAAKQAAKQGVRRAR
ncbi:MAG: transcriptional regulator [Actinomycetota bacterium]|nr:transcriptional regulator [Actinomycetota bacterium]